MTWLLWGGGAVLVLVILMVSIRSLTESMKSRQKEDQSARNLIYLQGTWQHPPHTHWDDDGYLVDGD